MVFIKKQEDFVCAHCGAEVKGSGYTNHCPKCFWSKHVDIDPGDRASSCGGMMRPVRVEGGVGGYVVVHRCEKCGYESRVKSAQGDSTDALLALAKEAADGTM